MSMKGTLILSNKWDIRYLQLAQEVASWSKDPSTQLGAIAVGNKGQVLSQGYNGFLSGCPHTSIIENDHEQATVHAEQNAIADCAKRGVSCEGCTALITHYPCINCMKILCASGIKEIKYLEDYKNDKNVKYLSEISKISINKI